MQHEEGYHYPKPAAGRPNAITQAKPAPDAIAAALDAYGQLLAESNTPFTADKYTKLDVARAEHAREREAGDALADTVGRLLAITCPLKMGDPRTVQIGEALRLTAAVNTYRAARVS